MKPIKLTELEPSFMHRETATSWRYVNTIGEANGIKFLCPKCFEANNGPIGTHSIICWDPTVPQDTRPTPGRWSLVGTNFDDLTLKAGSSSIALDGGCAWHGYVTNGMVRDA